jgi:hypothetical protein
MYSWDGWSRRIDGRQPSTTDLTRLELDDRHVSGRLALILRHSSDVLAVAAVAELALLRSGYDTELGPPRITSAIERTSERPPDANARLLLVSRQ